MKKENRFYVYIHRRGDNNEIFYVGKGSGYRYRKESGRNNHWNNIVNKHGYSTEIIKDNLFENEAFELEIKMIDELKENICNMTDGGEGLSGYSPSEKQIERIRNLYKGKKLSEEHKRKLSESRKGKKTSDETKIKISKSLKGRKSSLKGSNISDEHKKKISSAMSGNGNPNYGKQNSKEARRKISEAQLGSKNHNSKKVTIVDIVTNKSYNFDTMEFAGKFLNVSPTTIRNYNKSKEKYKDRYLICIK